MRSIEAPSRIQISGRGTTVPTRLPAALDALADEPDVVTALWASFKIPPLARTIARRDTERLARAITTSPLYRDDFLFRVTALAVLGVLGGPHARAALTADVYAGPLQTGPYSALALTGNVRAESVPALAALLHAADPFARMAAQQALLSAGRGPAAAAAHGALVIIALADAPPATRIAAMECLTVTALQPATLPSLRRIAADEYEPHGVRGAAMRALGRVGDLHSTASLEAWALTCPSPAVRRAAAEALASLGPCGEQAMKRVAAAGVQGALRPPHHLRTDTLHLAQLVTTSTGGLATLIADLHAAFTRRSDVGRVTTLTWGGTASARTGMFGVESLVSEEEGPPDWDAALRIERALDHRFRGGMPDVLHLRFADVGTMAAARWAERRGVPIYFTFAPDPIVPMRLAAEGGLLTRGTLGDADGRERLVARTSILHELAQTADGIALLPRTDRAIQALGTDLFAGPARYIAEGIDVDAVTRARVPEGSARAVLEGARSPGHGRGFRSERRGLPALVSVGRLHPIKGLARLVAAWAGDSELARNVNLIVLGGSLEAPDDTERGVLDEIERITTRHPEIVGGLLLAGAQPHHRIPGLLTALHDGISGLTAPRAIYVCPSTKEEFGLAILEAMAAGLPVIAPNAGGPATYLRDGTLGFLANTTDIDSLAQSLHRALALRDDVVAYEAMSARGRHAVRAHYAVDRMAGDLIALYREGAAARLASAS